ncbi:beta-ketoacyl synthase N-terminal-like domain-containing protein [Streptomyces uncialis]|uniref:beta-ketoacyl synthase N-terminal-like domain-containing protein n=1 Tax=Streptomyces uncialis TaxID=1048205 RepID=UPI0033F330FC
MATEYTDDAPRALITGIGVRLAGHRGAEGLWRAAMTEGAHAAPPPPGSKTDLLGTVVDEALADAGFPLRPATPASGVSVLVCAQAAVGAAALPPFLHGADTDVLTTRAGRAPVTVVSHACATGGFAVRLAVQRLLSGRSDVVVVAGASVPDPMEEISLDAVGVLAKGTVRPLDVRRDGIAVGRGAVALVLERAGGAAARDVTGAVAVAATACLVKPGRAESDPAAVGAVLRAVLAPTDGPRCPPVDAVCAHATGTAAGDATELEQLALLGAELGWRDVPVFSHKGALGHLLHTSALAAVAHSAEAVRRSVVPGTPGCGTPMNQGQGVRVSTESTPAPLGRVLVNAFGFGGNYASVLLEKHVHGKEPHDG